MEDYLVRIIAREAGVRGLACVTTGLVNQICQKHGTAPTATAFLGRALTGGALLGALLKVQQRVALKLEGTGPLQKAIVESDAYGRLRGYVAVPDLDLPLKQGRQEMETAIGRAGLLTVVRDLRLKELAEGVVPLEDGAVDTDLMAYFDQSEQIPTAVAIDLAMNEDGMAAVSGGLLIQTLPPHEQNEGVVARLKDRIQELPPLGQLLQDGKSPEDVLALLFEGIEYEVLEKRPLRFQCDCSRERSEKALITLGREAIEQLLAEEREAVIDCHFCHERYVFDAVELELILEEMEG
ncbi:MAG: Hsp33 family molecular chaperone HslO [Ardenticatenaceae bacterium]|nr:Hsp33 family molecular chaperone HslO [Ardenticatenaceae bacterium]MCB9442756.1 Hsp33 family molecular chaperone HslO [Ardenticatenaceae bacterium]